MPKINAKNMISRFLIPKFIVTIYYFLKFRAKVSTSAEVECTKNITLGRETTISSFTKVKASIGKLSIGARGGIATGCFISTGEAGIEIGKNFVCGPNVIITSSNYITDKKDIHYEDQGHTSKGVKIGNNVWIGGGSVILDGTVIGDNTIVVANSLVNRRFKSDVVIQGNPAKVLITR